MKGVTCKKSRDNRRKRTRQLAGKEFDYMHEKLFKHENYPASFREMWDAFLSFSRFGF